MNTARQIREVPDRDTGATEDYIPLWGFAEDGHSFLTTAGEIGVVLEMQGAEYECLDPEDLHARARRFETALRPFDEDYRLYQFVMKTHGAEVPHREQYCSPVVDLAVQERIRQVSAGTSIRAYLVIIMVRFRQPVTSWEKLKESVVSRWSDKVLGATLAEQIGFSRLELLASVKTMASQMEDHSPLRLLAAAEAFRFFRRHLNPDYETADTPRLQWGNALARQLADTETKIHRDHVLIGEHAVRVLTLKDPPMETAANLLRPIIEADSQCTIVTEWRREPHEKMRKLIKSKKNHALVFSNIEWGRGAAAAAAGSPQTKDPKPSRSQKDAAKKLDAALSAMENEGLTFGRFSLSVVVRDSDPARLAMSVSRLYKSFAELGISVYPETRGLWRQYCATIPGNDRHNKRYQYLSVRNYTDLSVLFLPQSGLARNEQLNDEYLIALSTRQHTPYLLNLHWGDSPHAFVCGVNGSGKTFSVNAFVTHAQKYSPWTLILDIGGSYRTITERFGGSYLEMDPARMGCTINPFVLPKTPKNCGFLYSFVRLLIESGEYVMTDEDKRDLYASIQAIYTFIPSARTLGTLYWMIRVHLRPHLARWVRKDSHNRPGQYGSIFDNIEDTMTLQRFQTCDFTGVDDVPEIAEPLLFYVLHRGRAHVYDPDEADVYKLTVADECWRLLDTEITKRYLITALKTWRKHNAAMWMITQQPEDLIAAKVERILAEAQTSVLLANPRMNEEAYRQLFKLNDTEIREVRALQPKREMLIKQPFLSKIVQLDATDMEVGLYSSTPQQQLKNRQRSA